MKSKKIFLTIITVLVVFSLIALAILPFVLNTLSPATETVPLALPE